MAAWADVGRLVVEDTDRHGRFEDLVPKGKNTVPKPYLLITLKGILEGFKGRGHFTSTKQVRKLRQACLIGANDVLFERGLIPRLRFPERKLPPPRKVL